ncbi:MAG TPA: plastocyanin/azurin family copper-binding protein [Gemmatimonadaceae bacterium]|nr:plastocyanin/azurin family copper-binding protein [Gemmatimonadaceae bacterium]
MKKDLTILLAAVSILACAKSENGAADSSTAAPAAAQNGEGQPQAGGKTIVVEATTDEKGNYFTPNKIEAHRGDVLRFTLKLGVHNVHFLPDSNPGKKNLPPASEMLQLPGQTIDIPVNFEPGKYYFQCDPHAALGMKGQLEVEDEDHQESH